MRKNSRLRALPHRVPARIGVLALALWAALAGPAAAADQIYFPATDDVASVLVQKINAETVRIDMSIWHLTEHSISIALLNRFNAGVQVRLIGDRAELFELNPVSKAEFYWLANEGVPIRVRVNPTWYPEIAHWKATIFAGQNLVTFGSANYTPFELAPVSPTNYKDETVLFSDDPTIVNAFKAKFDQIWNDTTVEPQSLIAGPPYLKDWNEACATEPTGNCADYPTLYPTPKPMVINAARLEPDSPMPPDLIWSQGSSFNNRLVQEINNEASLVQLVVYRLTVDNITTALLNKWAAGVPVQILIEPTEYLNKKWPEFWLTHANIDKLWAAGVPIKSRVHQGLTHMKTLVTSSYAVNASANYAAAWQRDHNYFISAAAKPAIYQAIKDRVSAMWNDSSAFAPFQPQPPDAPVLAAPVDAATGVPTTPTLVWDRAPFATSYDVYLGTSSSSLALVANVPAQLVNSPPLTYSWAPPALQGGTTYFWRVVSRTFATPVNPALVAQSATRSFTTAGTASPPAPPTSPSPSSGALDVSLTPTLGWSTGAFGTTFDVAFGTSNPPPPVASGLTASSYQPGTLAPSTTFYWRVTSVSGGSSTPGPLWSFTTASSGGATPTDIVIYAADVTTVAGTWLKTGDSSAAAGIKLTNPDNGVGALTEPLAAPTNYFETSFTALGGTRYRVWLRMRAIADQKWNDSVFVQFSDSVTGDGSAAWRIGTTDGYIVNLWPCAACQSVGWGWQRGAYWIGGAGDVWFQNSGAHTIRVQIREDGAEIDQIVLSPTTYATTAPGPVSNDATIVPKPAPSSGPATPGGPSPADGATGVDINATLGWNSTGASTYDVRFGTSNPPPQVVAGTSSATYAPSMVYSTTYYWQIVAHNSEGSATGPIWALTTAAAPQPPASPTTPNPPNAATGVATTPTLTWSAAGATIYDVRFGTANPPPLASSAQAAASYSPAALAHATTYFWQIVARNSVGTTTGAVWSFTTSPAPPADIVIYGSDVPAASLHGSWSSASDPSSPGGTKLATPDAGVAQTGSPLAAPVDYFDVTFTPDAGRPYRIWLRLRALSNSKYNDAVWVQFSSAQANGSPVYPLGSPSGLLVNLATDASASSLNGWGWQNTAYWLAQATTITFPAGPQTMRVQVREDGVELDQIVFSPSTYLNAAPGPPTNDATIVPKPTPPTPPAAPASPTPLNGATGVSANPTLSWSAAGATSYDVQLGTTTPPPTVATGHLSSSYSPATLPHSSVIYWRIVARNGAGTTEGPIWSFTTSAPPPPPAPPASPDPADGAAAVGTTPTLSWSATGATRFDVRFGVSNPPPLVSSAQVAATYTPSALAHSTTYFWQIVAINDAGTASGAVWSFTTAAPPPSGDIVVYASEIPSAALNGSWQAVSDPTSPNGVKLATPDNGFAQTGSPLAAPTHYFDVSFTAEANRPYTVWLRLRAQGNSKWNDAVWVQFSGAVSGGAQVYPIGSTSGLLVNLATDATAASLNNWGWQNTAYWLSQPTTVTFATAGPQTLRVQVREDGVELDQIVLSPTTYLNGAPGPVGNDSTIVPKP